MATRREWTARSRSSRMVSPVGSSKPGGPDDNSHAPLCHVCVCKDASMCYPVPACHTCLAAPPSFQRFRCCFLSKFVSWPARRCQLRSQTSWRERVVRLARLLRLVWLGNTLRALGATGIGIEAALECFAKGPLCTWPTRRTGSDRPGSTNPKHSQCLEWLPSTIRTLSSAKRLRRQHSSGSPSQGPFPVLGPSQPRLRVGLSAESHAVGPIHGQEVHGAHCEDAQNAIL